MLNTSESPRFRAVLFGLALLCALVQAAAAQSADAVADSPRILTVDESVGELLENPASRRILEKELPLVLSNPQIEQARALSLRSLQVFAPTVITNEKLESINAALTQAGAMSEPGRPRQAEPVALDPREALALKTVPLWEERAPGAKGEGPLDIPALTIVRPDGATSFGTAVIVAPGGGYQMLATGHEGRQVADWLAAHGVTAFVLSYRLCTSGYHHPTQLQDAQRAIRWVRAHANDYGIDRNRIGMIGFSAGGHLTAMAATLFDDGDPKATDPIDRNSSRPDFAILAYAPLDNKGGKSWTPCILDDAADLEARKQVIPSANVSSRTPPTFLFHTSTDELVTPQDATAFYDALHAAGVSAELHVFATGRHGLGLAMTDPALALWPELLSFWLRGQNLIGSGVVNSMDP